MTQQPPSPEQVEGGASDGPRKPLRRVSYTPYEFCELARMKKDTVYRAIKNGEIKAVKFGRLYRIPASEVVRLFGTGDAA